MNKNFELELSLADFLLNPKCLAYTFTTSAEALEGWNIIKNNERELETLYESGMLQKPYFTFSADGLEVSKVSKDFSPLYNPYIGAVQSFSTLESSSELRTSYAPALDAILNGGIVSFSTRKEINYFRTLCHRKGIKIRCNQLNAALASTSSTSSASASPNFEIIPNIGDIL